MRDNGCYLRYVLLLAEVAKVAKVAVICLDSLTMLIFTADAITSFMVHRLLNGTSSFYIYELTIAHDQFQHLIITTSHPELDDNSNTSLDHIVLC